MAVDAGIARAPTAGQIPVADHPAVQAAIIIPPLRPVTLRAKRHAVDERHRPGVRQPERIVILRIVATQAGKIAVVVFQALMKLIQIRRSARTEVWFRGRVARTARSHPAAGGVLLPRLGSAKESPTSTRRP